MVVEPTLAPHYRRPTVQAVRAALQAANVPLATRDSFNKYNSATVEKLGYGDQPLSAQVNWHSGHQQSVLFGKTYFHRGLVLVQIRRILIEAGFRVEIHHDRWRNHKLLVLSGDVNPQQPDVPDCDIERDVRDETIRRLQEQVEGYEAQIEKATAPLRQRRDELLAQIREMEQEPGTEYLYPVREEG